MTKEEKQILLADLCARLPYGVMIKDQDGDYINVNIYNAHLEHIIDQISEGIVKMVLRPMPSMTEEEKDSFTGPAVKLSLEYLVCENSEPSVISQGAMTYQADWVNQHHFDYRGLIERGLALEAPKDMYK